MVGLNCEQRHTGGDVQTGREEHGEHNDHDDHEVLAAGEILRRKHPGGYIGSEQMALTTTQRLGRTEAHRRTVNSKGLISAN
jgi:hypothetical protein